MPAASPRRAPSLAEILRVLAALEKHGVRYALLGGVAMAIHGFPRMTKDIDCIFPRNKANNTRLMKAINALGAELHFDYLPEKEWLDKGYSTAAEGEIGIDILFVAAEKKFEDYESHIEEREIDGVRFKVLNIDGMLMSKNTNRPEDVPDRIRLNKLKP